MKRNKIIKDLESKDYVLLEGRVYFKSINGYIVSLPEKYYFKRLGELREYFSKRDAGEQKRLILENLGLFASPLPDRDYSSKIEIIYQSGVCTVVKLSDYPPSEDCKDIDHNPSFDIRDSESLNPWRTERNDWLSELAKKIKREIFGED